MQYHQAGGVHHFVAGAACEYAFYQGFDHTTRLNWVDTSKSLGFLAAELYANKLVFKFIAITSQPHSQESFRVIKEIIIER